MFWDFLAMGISWYIDLNEEAKNKNTQLDNYNLNTKKTRKQTRD